MTPAAARPPPLALSGLLLIVDVLAARQKAPKAPSEAGKKTMLCSLLGQISGWYVAASLLLFFRIRSDAARCRGIE